MKLQGKVLNGVVVLDGGAGLPEGAEVTVLCRVAPVSRPRKQKKRVQLPLVPSRHPASLELTGERIAQVLEEEELASLRKSMRPSEEL